MERNKTIIHRPPKATEFNKDQFCAAWIECYGGTYRNALWVYLVELRENKNGSAKIIDQDKNT